jgi:hypothetical protein
MKHDGRKREELLLKLFHSENPLTMPKKWMLSSHFYSSYDFAFNILVDATDGKQASKSI